MDRLTGQALGDFRVLDPIGQGSMSRVFRAVQISLHRPVALKVFQEELLTTGEAVERFQREAEYLAQFEHPNILPVYGAGQHGGLHWFALRLVTGGTLAEWLLTRPRPRAIWSVMRDVAGALAYLHGKGGVHRDLKPSNVLLERGTGILADFGLARLVEDSTITGSGAMLGTPAYMAPEQWRRERAAPASDVFSFGVILYEALAGRHPFLDGAAERPGSSLRDQMRTHLLQGEVRPIEGTGLPPGVDEVLRRCLAAEAAARFEDARPLERALDAVRWPPEEGDGLTTRIRDVEPTVRVEPRREESTAASRTTPPEGTPFGRYVLRGELGKGGMGVVYRAWDPSLAREVALKVLRGGEMASSEEITRFEREARAAARLRHPNIVSVHEVGVESSRHYFTMDLVEGRSLREVLESDLLSLEEALRLLVQVARAVHHAHENGIIHRDLKPANILVEGKGRALVGDFGLAREVSGADGATVSGAVLGTPAYMSPEQARGEGAGIDSRSDVYSLGAVLYQTLTRRPPFQGEGVVAVLHQVMTSDPVPPRRVNPLVPRDLDVLCMKALERSRERRYQTAGELADDVERYLRREPIRARPPSAWYGFTRRVARNPAAWAIGAALLALGAVFAVYGLHKREQTARRVEGLWQDARAAEGRGDLGAAADLYAAVLSGDASREDAVEGEQDCRRRLAEIDRLTASAHSVQDMRQRLALWTRIIELNPAAGTPYYERGMLHNRLSLWNEAISDLEQAVARDPRLVRARIRLAGLYEHVRHDLDAMERQLEAAAEADPEGSSVPLARSYGLIRARRWQEALEMLDRALAQWPDFAPGFLNRAVCREHLGDTDGALADYAKAIEVHATYANAYYDRAMLYRNLGRLAEAEADVRHAVALDPTAWHAHDQLGMILQDQGKVADAEAAYTLAAYLAPTEGEPLAHRGLLRITRGRIDEGRADAEAAIRADTACSLGLSYRGYASWIRGDRKAAEEDLEAALQVDPDDTFALMNRGVILVELDRPEEALPLFDRAVELSPRDGRAYVNRALAHRALERMDRAEEEYRKAIDVDARLADGWLGLGQCLQGRKEFGPAREAFTKAIDLGMPRGYYNRASCRADEGDLKGALEDFRKVLELDKDAKRQERARAAIGQIERTLGESPKR